MPECDYCSEAFESEEEYLEHLRAEHYEELGRIDRRRVEGVTAGDEDEGLPVGPLLIVGVILLGAVMVGAVLVVTTGIGQSTDEPTNVGAVHDHGTIEIVIEGEELDLYDGEFVRDREHDAFHFHRGYEQYDAYVWHVHAEGVTIQYALGTLDIEVDDEGTELTYDGETYSEDDPGTSVRFEVNGEPVEPGEHVLDGAGPVDQGAAGAGDDVRIVVETGD